MTFGKYIKWGLPPLPLCHPPTVNPCELHCRPTSEYFSEKMLDTVTDGTPCFMNNKSRNICVNGVCKVVWLGKRLTETGGVEVPDNQTCCIATTRVSPPCCLAPSPVCVYVFICSVCLFCLQEVGCDFGIDSNAVEDRCGVCLGDGTSCKTVHKTFDEGEGFGEFKRIV